MKKLLLLILFLSIPAASFAALCNAGINSSVITTTTSCTSSQDDKTIKANASGGAITITLETCTSSRRGVEHFFQKTDSSGNAVTINPNGAETINGLATISLSSARNVLVATCDGAGDWLSKVGTFSGIGTGTIGTSAIANDSITEPKLKAVNSPTDEYCLTYESTVGDFEWQACGGTSGLVIASTTITGGSGSTNVLTDNSGVLAEVNITSYESALEGVMDLQDMQGAVTDAQVPNNITIDLATAATALAANGTNCSSGSFPLGVDASGNSESCTALSASNAGTATALAANGSNCSSGQFPLGVDASGAAESCTALPTTISGTSEEITASASTGAVTLSLPDPLNLGTKSLKGASPLVFEGATADANETTVNITDPTADHTITIPNADTVTVQGSSCSGTDKVTGINASTGAISCSSDLNGSTSGDPAEELNSRRVGFCSIRDTTETVPICWGTMGSTASPEVLTNSGVTIAIDRNHNNAVGIKYQTAGTSGAIAGTNSPNYTAVTSNTGWGYYDPFIATTFATDSTITTMRFFIGLSQAPNVNDFTGLYTTSTTTSVSNGNAFFVAYDTAGQANTANFQCCAAIGDGAASSMACTDMGLAVAGSTLYTVKVDCRNAQSNGYCKCDVNGTSTNSPSKIASGALNLGYMFQLRTLANAARALIWYKMGTSQR